MTRDPDPEARVSLAAAARRTRLTEGRVREAIRLGFVPPQPRDGSAEWFTEADLRRLRRIRRLREDLGLNSAGIEVVLRLIDQIELLQAGQPTTRTRVTVMRSGGPRWQSISTD
jgi:MerR family transcriptional regulator/heat shock protein HspR